MCKIVDTIPHGNYTFVGLDVDTTGRRLIDEVTSRFPILINQQILQIFPIVLSIDCAHCCLHTKWHFLAAYNAFDELESSSQTASSATCDYRGIL